MATRTPYDTVAPFFGSSIPAWVDDPVEKARLASYDVYEDIFWNHPETFKLVTRGADNLPIYVPSGRIIIETTNRYLAKGLNYSIDPLLGTPEQRATADLWFKALFRRERIRSKWSSEKMFMLVRGEMIFHVTADDQKLPGSRISVTAVNPRNWFPVYDENNLDKLLKVHLAEQTLNARGDTVIRRQTYEKLYDEATGKTLLGILSSEGLYEVKGWMDEQEAKLLEEIRPPALLPPQVRAIPVYHFKNFEEGQNPYGSSELRGLERVMAGINQAISDEDLALALEGLGVYVSGAGGAPVDDEGNDVQWIIGPGRVIEDETFKRVPGIGSVTPYSDHISTLKEFLYEGSGATDAARGKVDVTVAESGIALMLQLGPILSKVENKEEHLVDVGAQFFFDLKGWHEAYEGVSFPEVEFLPTFTNPLPVNRKGLIEEVVLMMSSVPPLMSATTGREILAEAGVKFAPDELARLVQEAQLQADAAGGTGAVDDNTDQRINEELPA